MKKSSFILLVFIFFASCANVNKKITFSDVESNSQFARLASCEKFYLALDNAVKSEKVTDIQTTPINGTPFLSTNRFLISFKPALTNKEKIDFWLEETAKLNKTKRGFEWLNLSITSKKNIQQTHLSATSFSKRISSCSKEFLHRLNKEQKQQLINSASTYEDFSTTLRALGLFPLTSKIFKNQVEKHHKKTRETFNKKLNQLTMINMLQRYVPDTKSGNLTFDNVVKKENALNIPFVSSREINDLFLQFAPTIEVDEAALYDKIGDVALDSNRSAYINTNQPKLYIMPSYTRFEGKSLLQLNYIFWFSERPSEKSFDLYAGKFDSLIWRVTLNENFQPIIFDSAHSCGCYHKFYTTKNIKFKLQTALREDEPPFLAQNNLEYTKNQNFVLRVSSAKHFIERVYQDERFDKNAKVYSMKNYQQLRSLPGKGKNRSFFSDAGIVKASKRSERLLLWPLGLPSAGAMRQWGHHPIAYIDKRYFDDPDLLSRYFEGQGK